MHDLETLIARTRAVQSTAGAPNLQLSADLDRLVRRLHMILQAEGRRADGERGDRTIAGGSEHHAAWRQRLYHGAVPLHTALGFCKARIEWMPATGIAKNACMGTCECYRGECGTLRQAMYGGK